MIDINFVPIELRKKKRSSRFPGGVNIPLEVIIGVGGGLLMLLICVHIFLFALNVQKIAAHKTLQNKWNAILPEKEKVDFVINHMRELQSRVGAIGDATKVDGIIWAQKLSILSESLPRGVWIKKFELTDSMLFIQGSAISRLNQEMFEVHQFTSNLKASEDFLKGLDDLELGSIQSQKVSTTEVADFLITANLE